MHLSLNLCIYSCVLFLFSLRQFLQMHILFFIALFFKSVL
nr:MAG TPA: hypothetical protein [Caudoviricetes sp.]DAX04654.1 MAG TPA: hypothetical protein [Bacteriophage sp.]